MTKGVFRLFEIRLDLRVFRKLLNSQRLPDCPALPLGFQSVMKIPFPD
jgi:hypothetical protein